MHVQVCLGTLTYIHTYKNTHMNVYRMYGYKCVCFVCPYECVCSACLWVCYVMCVFVSISQYAIKC